MKPKTRNPFLFSSFIAALLASQSLHAAGPYYWDNLAGAGFGTAGGTWSATTAGPIPGWNTDSTGAAAPGSVTTATADAINFGNGATGLGGGIINVSGTVASGSMTFASGSGAITLAGGAITLPATSTITVNNASNTIGSGLSGATTSVTKAGTGVLTLSGTNSYTGNTVVTGGTLEVTGSITGNTTTSTLSLGSTATNTVANVSGNMTLFNITGAAVAGSNVAYNQTAGTVNVTPTAASLFQTNTGYDYLNLTGGTLKVNAGTSLLASGSGVGVAYVGGTGIFDLSSANSNGGVVFGGSGSLTVGPGGSMSRAGATAAFYFNVSTNSYSTTNVAGGSLDLGSSIIRMGNGSGVTGLNGLINLAGGTLTLGTVVTNVATSTGNLYANYAGGTLKASAALTNPVTTSNGITTISTLFGPIDNNGTSQDFNGGLTVDTNGFNVSYANPLRGVASNGIKQGNITVTGGSGYIGAPLVQFTGGTLSTSGTPAAGYAVVSGGAVTEIVITSPGTYTVAPTVTLLGGGGTGASVTLSALSANATDSGLTKTGSGTLTLSGANTYTGPTSISAGTISAGNIVVSSGSSHLGNAASAVILGSSTAQGTLSYTGNSATYTRGFTIGGASGGRLDVTASGQTLGVSTGAITGSGLFTVGGAGDTSISSNITHTGGLTKTDAGTLTLSGTNTYNGATTVSAGTLSLSGAGSLTGSSVSTSGTGIVTEGAGGSIAGSGATFTQASSGTSTLAGANTYTGATLISAGTLTLSGSGSVNNSSGISINGSGTKLLHTGGTAVTPAVTLTQGTLTGNGTVNTVNVGNGTGGIISNNNGAAGASLTVGTLAFGGAATVNTYSSNTTAPIITTSLSSNAAGTVTINPTAATWTNGSTYNLIGYGGSIGGAGFGQFALGTVSGLSARQTATFGNSGSAITLAIAGDAPYWSGNGDGKWNLTSTNNWKLLSNNGNTTFLALDTALFNDSASGAGPINVDIDAANVDTFSVTFNNSTKDYVLTGSGGFGISSGSLTKSGTGNLTISAVNTYSGATTISAGTITMSGSGTLGSGSALTLGGGRLNLGGTSQTVGTLSVTAPAVSGDTISNGSLSATSYAASNTTGNAIISASLLVNGTAGFTKSGSGTVTLSGTNTYTGATSVNAGSLAISGSGTLGNGADLALGGGQLDLGGSSQTVGAVSITAPAASGDTILNGSLTGTSYSASNASGTATVSANLLGTGAFSKSGTGTVTLSGTNAYTGNTTVTGGTLNVTGSYTGNTTSSTLSLGSAAASTVTNVSNDMTLYNVTGANIAGATTVYNQTAGIVTMTGANFSQNVASSGGYGYFNLTGGTFKTNTASFVVQSSGSTSSVGVAYVGGSGTIDSSAATTNSTIAFTGTGSLTIAPGGSYLHNTTSGALFLITNQNSYGVLNVAGGTADLGSVTTRIGNGTGAAFTGMNGFINLAAGTLSTGAATSNAGNSANNLYANFAGGTLKATASIGSPFASGNGVTTTSTVFGAINNLAAVGNTSQNFTGGLTVDTNTFNMTYGNALRGASGDGVTQAVMSITGGSGYTGAPMVQFTGGTLAANGTPASGYAVISGGAVTGIVITSPGCYTSAPTVTLTGGGGTGASVSLGTLTANAADGGITKIGGGTLTLSGSNTYAGATTVSDGTLALGSTNVLPDTSAVSLGTATLDAATFTDTAGSLDAAGSAVINLGTGAALAFADSSAISWSGGSLTITGTYVSGSSLRFGTTSSGLTPAQLALISKPGGGAVILDSNGFLIDAPIGGYASWASINAIGSNPDQDKDGDGVKNAVEYVLGGTVSANDLSKLPGISTSGGNMNFTFKRDQNSIDGTTIVTIEVGTTLGAWPSTYTVGVDTATSTTGVSVLQGVPTGFDTITLSIPQAPDAKKFARLNVVVAP